MHTIAHKWLPVLFLAGGLITSVAFGQTAAEIIQKSVGRDLNDFDRQKNYTYQERTETRELDSGGAVEKTESETKEVMTLRGQRVSKVIAKNDKPLDEREARKEQERLDHTLERREGMSPTERAKREKEREENRKFIARLPEAFTFTMDHEEKISGKPAWVIAADPNPDFKPTNMQEKIFSKVRGKVWIDKGEYQWVRAEMEVLDTISMGMALFRISPGGSIKFEQTRVNDEVWLPSHTLIRADARLAYVKKIRAEIEINYSGYKKFQSDSKVVSVEEKQR
jgi:hypothetical protein